MILKINLFHISIFIIPAKHHYQTHVYVIIKVFGKAFVSDFIYFKKCFFYIKLIFFIVLM